MTLIEILESEARIQDSSADFAETMVGPVDAETHRTRAARLREAARRLREEFATAEKLRAGARESENKPDYNAWHLVVTVLRAVNAGPVTSGDDRE